MGIYRVETTGFQSDDERRNPMVQPEDAVDRSAFPERRYFAQKPATGKPGYITVQGPFTEAEAKAKVAEWRDAEPVSGIYYWERPDVVAAWMPPLQPPKQTYVEAVARFHVQMVAELAEAEHFEHVASLARLVAIWEDVQEASKALAEGPPRQDEAP